MVALCNRAEHIYFHPVVCSSSFFFPHLISAATRPQVRCLPYFHTWCGLSVNLRCRSETCCMQICIWSSSCHRIVSCFVKLRTGLTCHVLAYPDCPRKRPSNGCLTYLHAKPSVPCGSLERFVTRHISINTELTASGTYLPEPYDLWTVLHVRFVLCASLPVVNVNLLHSAQHQLHNNDSVQQSNQG